MSSLPLLGCKNDCGDNCSGSAAAEANREDGVKLRTAKPQSVVENS
jgi:hypothetical protein